MNSSVVTVKLTQRQADFLLALLDGFACREQYRMSDGIIRQVRQVGSRVAKASGRNWPHESK